MSRRHRRHSRAQSLGAREGEALAKQLTSSLRKTRSNSVPDVMADMIENRSGVVVKEGELAKCTLATSGVPSKGTFQRRWCWVVETREGACAKKQQRSAHFVYTKDFKNKTNTKEVDLADAHVKQESVEGRHIFKVAWQDKLRRDYVLECASYPELTDWSHTIARVIPTEVTVEVYENQRLNPLTSGWSHKALRPGEKHWEYASRAPSAGLLSLETCGLAAACCPDKHWHWIRPWGVAQPCAGVETDADGWQYAMHWPGAPGSAIWSSQRGDGLEPQWLPGYFRTAYVRRRRYTRTRLRDFPMRVMGSGEMMGPDLELSEDGEEVETTNGEEREWGVSQDAASTGLLVSAGPMEGEICKEGYLWKRGAVNTRHRRRYFVLQTASGGQRRKATAVLYYSKEPGSDVLGSIDLSDTIVHLPPPVATEEFRRYASADSTGSGAPKAYKQFNFEVRPRGLQFEPKRVYFIGAESQAEMDAWTVEINKVIPPDVIVEIWQNQCWDSEHGRRDSLDDAATEPWRAPGKAGSVFFRAAGEEPPETESRTEWSTRLGVASWAADFNLRGGAGCGCRV